MFVKSFFVGNLSHHIRSGGNYRLYTPSMDQDARVILDIDSLVWIPDLWFYGLWIPILWFYSFHDLVR